MLIRLLARLRSFSITASVRTDLDKPVNIPNISLLVKQANFALKYLKRRMKGFTRSLKNLNFFQVEILTE